MPVPNDGVFYMNKFNKYKLKLFDRGKEQSLTNIRSNFTSTTNLYRDIRDFCSPYSVKQRHKFQRQALLLLLFVVLKKEGNQL